MKREEIDKRIYNEKKLREQGYSNREISEIMGVSYVTIIRDIGKEPKEFRAKRALERPGFKSPNLSKETVSFPGSIKSEEPEPEPVSPFERAWRNGENLHKASHANEDAVFSAVVPEGHRTTKIIVGTVDEAMRAWNSANNVAVKVEDLKLYFDAKNSPWMAIVYREV